MAETKLKPFARLPADQVPNNELFVCEGMRGIFVWIATSIVAGAEVLPPRRVLCQLEKGASQSNSRLVGKPVKEETRKLLLGEGFGAETPRAAAVTVLNRLGPLFMLGKPVLFYRDCHPGLSEGNCTRGCIYRVSDT